MIVCRSSICAGRLAVPVTLERYTFAANGEIHRVGKQMRALRTILRNAPH